jgi:uncharacterized protein (TIGR02996 family)
VLLTDAFLLDIIESPEDDAPRLVYADFLDDLDQPDRAEFIRVQCRRASLPADHPEQRKLASRESDLLLLHEADWRSTLPELEGVTWEDFQRGFVESAFIESAEVFLREAEALFAAAPVRRVRIGRLDDVTGEQMARSPFLGRLLELNLGNNSGLTPAGVRALADSPHLAGMNALLLHYNPLGNVAVASLARSHGLGKLRELYLSGTEVGDAGVVALAGQGRLPELIDLDLRDNQVGDPGARSLAHNNNLEQLRTIWLVNNQIGESGAEALAWSERLPRLERLYLNYNPIGNNGAAAFAESPHRTALLELDLRHCRIGDAGGRALAASPYLENLELLMLSGNRLRMETLTLLRRRFGQRLRI